MRRVLLLCVLVAAVGVSAAHAATAKPTASSGGTRDLTSDSVTLLGTVNPKGTATSFTFEYGPTQSYGSQSAPVAVGAGTTNVAVTANLTGLTPGATYHYRLVATNANGNDIGRDRNFTAKPLPLAFSLSATPNPVLYGLATTVSGQVTGSGAAGEKIVLQQNAFPFTAGFKPLGAQQTTDANGRFSFPVVGLTTNTQFRAMTADKRSTSPTITVGSSVIVRTTVNRTRVRAHRLVRFSGTVSPPKDGSLFAVQRRRSGKWRTVGGGSLKTLNSTRSRYAKSIRVAHSGRYRVFVRIADGAHVSNASSIRRIRIVRG